MAKNSPLRVLHNLAEQTLNNTTSQLGKVQKTWREAINQLQALENYANEYQQQLQDNMVGKGMSVTTLLAHQSFITSLNKVVTQHSSYVETCQTSVDQTMQLWHRDRQRLTSFEALQNRAEAAQRQTENRLEQKMMDEFAQRANLKNEKL